MHVATRGNAARGGVAERRPRTTRHGRPPCDDFQLDPIPLQLALIDATGKAVDNPADDPGAELQTGNLPYNQTNCVHTVEDVSIVAAGPGSHRFNGFLDNTEVFHAIIDALGLDARK